MQEHWAEVLTLEEMLQRYVYVVDLIQWPGRPGLGLVTAEMGDVNILRSIVHFCAVDSVG